jgi:hypothetical protein
MWERRSSPYNGNTVIIDVSGVVELILQIRVRNVRLDTTRVQRGLVNSVVEHFSA